MTSRCRPAQLTRLGSGASRIRSLAGVVGLRQAPAPPCPAFTRDTPDAAPADCLPSPYGTSRRPASGRSSAVCVVLDETAKASGAGVEPAIVGPEPRSGGSATAPHLIGASWKHTGT